MRTRVVRQETIGELLRIVVLLVEAFDFIATLRLMIHRRTIEHIHVLHMFEFFIFQLTVSYAVVDANNAQFQRF